MIGDVLLRIVQWVRGEVLAQEGEERGEGARTKEDSVHSLQGRSSTLLYYAMFQLGPGRRRCFLCVSLFRADLSLRANLHKTLQFSR